MYKLANNTLNLLNISASSIAISDKNLYYLNGEGTTKTLASSDLEGQNTNNSINNYFIESFDYNGSYTVYYILLDQKLDGYIIK